LPAEQRAQLDVWLFEENCTYREVVERCREHFGVEAGKSSVARYYDRGAEVREGGLVERSRAAAKEGAEASSKEGAALSQALLKVGEGIAVERARAPGKEVDTLTVARLVRLLIAAKREGHEADRVALGAERVAIVRAKFEFDAAAACLRHHSEIVALVGNE